ncbi:MAG: lanthionine synthetase LanC family protein [Bacteroidota bacterium]
MQLTISTGQRIINTLLLNASFIDNLGLMHGKMGISICFFHLARQTGNQIYEDYAGELIDEIYEEITTNTPVDFENGLAGIGWGIEYLVQNGFIEADTDEVLEEFDNRIFKELIYNTPQENGLLNGLTGLGAYFLKRIQPACRQGRNPAANDEKIPALTNKLREESYGQTLIHLIDELERKTQNIPEIISEPFEQLNNTQTSNSVSPGIHERSEMNSAGRTNPESAAIRDNKPQTTNKIFDLTWNYPALLWFLAELYKQNIFNFKVKKIIQRFTEPLSNESNMPKLQSHRLLLALALTKLQQTATEKLQTKNHKPRTRNHEQQTTNNIKFSNQVELSNFPNIQKRISNLLYGINRNTINSELPPHNTTLRYGTPGIAWIYKELHRQTGDNHFKEEMEYWQQLSFESETPYDVFPGMNNKDLNAWGLLEGLAGILLNTEMINLKKPMKHYNS